MIFLLWFPVRKSSKTWLLHLGHLGLLSKDMMMYMRQLGQPTTTIDLAPPLSPSASSEHNDDDELSVGKDDESNDGEIFSFRSSSRLLAAASWFMFLAFQEVYLCWQSILRESKFFFKKNTIEFKPGVELYKIASL